jgi:hypothetical protein
MPVGIDFQFTGLLQQSGSLRSHEVIYDAVVDVKSFFKHTLTATPQRPRCSIDSWFAL